MLDQRGDNHGYMILRIHADKIVAGKPVLNPSKSIGPLESKFTVIYLFLDN